MKQLKFAARYVGRHWWQYVLGILAARAPLAEGVPDA